MILSTVGPGGTDASPGGDRYEVARIVDAKTLWLPDWKGNNRLDSLKNIVEDGRLSLMFMVSGSDAVVRINGEAILTADDDITSAFERDGKLPCTVTVITVSEVYFQCAKALMRSGPGICRSKLRQELPPIRQGTALVGDLVLVGRPSLVIDGHLTHIKHSKY